MAVQLTKFRPAVCAILRLSEAISPLPARESEIKNCVFGGPSRRGGGKWRRGIEFFVENLLARIDIIIVMIRKTGLAPWEFDFPFSGKLTCTFLGGDDASRDDFVRHCPASPAHSA